MPLEAGACCSTCRVGEALWFLCGAAIDGLLGLAHAVASAKGAVALQPSMPDWAFGLMVAGGLWLCLWNSRPRLWGLVPAAIGALGAMLSPAPDLLITGDGKHLAIVGADRTPFILRDRAGDYVRSLVAEASGFDGDPLALDVAAVQRLLQGFLRGAAAQGFGASGGCSRLDPRRRSTGRAITRACAAADIVVSDRGLPRGCTPRWLKLDRYALATTGGVAIYLGRNPRVDTVADRVGGHPWAQFAPLGRAPHRKLASRRIDELEPPSAGKRENRLGDDSTGLGHRSRARLRGHRPGSPAAAPIGNRRDRPGARRRSSRWSSPNRSGRNR